jgi:uncharacterized membrane protein
VRTQSIAGFIGPTYGWRVPFVIIAAPSIFVIALVMLTMQEPTRSSHHHHHHDHHHAEDAVTELKEEDADEEPGFESSTEHVRHQLRKFLDVFVIRTNLLAFLQSVPGCLPWGCV